MRSIGLRILGALLAVIAWWAGTDLLAASSPILGAMGPAKAWDALVYLVGKGTLLDAVSVSLQRLFLGLGLAIAAGIALGLLLGWLKWAEQLTSIPVQFLRMVSPLAWMPIAVVIFGIGTPPVVFLIFIAAVWPIALATSSGVRQLEPKWHLLAKSFGATAWERLVHIVVPGIRSNVLTGIRLALAVSWIVLVPAEMLGVDSGLGYSILNSRDQLAYDQLAAIMLTIGVLGFAIDWIAQKLFSLWSKSK
ncbi:MAG: ABC transporter permease [Micrococcales bacterium]